MRRVPSNSTRHPKAPRDPVASPLGMRGPGYRWRCHKCERVNEPGAGFCTHCRFPAVARGTEVARARGEPNPPGEGYRSLGKPLWLLILFPWEWF